MFLVAAQVLIACDVLYCAIAWPIRTLACVPLATILADLISGHVHWLADAYAPYSSAFEDFEVHHLYPAQMTKYPNEYTLYEVSLLTLALHLPLLVGLRPTLLAALTLLQAFATNWHHKNAHRASPCALARALQFAGLAITSKHHSKHHEDLGHLGVRYCITTGACNALLDYLGYWRRLERLAYSSLGLESAHVPSAKRLDVERVRALARRKLAERPGD